MGLLGDLLGKRKKYQKPEVEEHKHNEFPPVPTKYNSLWLAKVVRDHGFALTGNEQRINNILKKLNERDGHCPCGGMTDEFLCPCTMMREHGTCKCGLYMNARDINPTGMTSTGRIKNE